MFISLSTAGMGFLRRPIAIVAAFLTALSIAFLNDRYAASCLFCFIVMYRVDNLEGGGVGILDYMKLNLIIVLLSRTFC